MRRKDNTNTLVAGHELEAARLLKGTNTAAPAAQLLALVAQLMDMIAEGEDIYLTIGTNKDKAAYLLNVVWNGKPDREAFTDLATLEVAANVLRSE